MPHDSRQIISLRHLRRVPLSLYVILTDCDTELPPLAEHVKPSENDLMPIVSGSALDSEVNKLLDMLG